MPTPLRLQQARQQGHVARSSELTSAASLAAVVGVLLLAGPGMAKAVIAMLSQWLGALSTAGNPDSLSLPWSSTMHVGGFAIVIAAVAAAVAGVIGLVQTRGLISVALVKPDWSRISASGGLGRIFNSRSLARLAGSLARLTIVGYVAWLSIADEGLALSTSIATIGWNLLGSDVLMQLMLRSAAVLVGLGIVDYLYQRWQHARDLRMSYRELREEYRRTEGDPQLKARRRQHRRSEASSAKCSLVLCDGRGLAVALPWSGGRTAPKLLNSGEGYLGKRIVQAYPQALVVEDDSLARRLHLYRRRNQPLPQAMLQKLAQMFALAAQGDERDENGR